MVDILNQGGFWFYLERIIDLRDHFHSFTRDCFPVAPTKGNHEDIIDLVCDITEKGMVAGGRTGRCRSES